MFEKFLTRPISCVLRCISYKYYVISGIAHLGMCLGALPSRRNHVAIVVHRLLRGLSGHPFRRLSADDFLSWRSVEKDDINGDGEVFDNLQSKLEH